MTVLAQPRLRRIPTRPTRVMRYVVPVAVLIDALAVSAAVIGAVWGRLRLGVFTTQGDVSSHAATVAPFLVLGWLLIIYLVGGYRTDVFGSGTDEFKRVVNGTLLTAGLLGVACYLNKFDLSRGFFFLTFAIGVPLLCLERAVIRGALHHVRSRGLLLQHVLLVGSVGHVDEIASVLRRESWLGYEVVAAVLPSHEDRLETPSGIPVVGDTDDLTALVRKVSPDVVVLAGGAIGSSARMRQLVWELEDDAVQVIVAPSVTDISAERVNIRPVGGLPLIHIDPPTWVNASRIGKRTFDLVGSAALLFFFAPVFAFSALAIKLADRGPVCFQHTRIGRNGEEFKCLKFRTMVVDAEARVEALQKQQGVSAFLFKMKDDPRITRPGKWLRRFSIDELPQLLNVLRGDMSLVGPRPQVAREVAMYDDAMVRRLHVRPGMTGLWQVSGRNDLTAEEAIRLDLYYVDNWSMLQDLSILRKTAGAVVTSRGAY